MTLHDLVETYIDFKRSLGMRLRSQTAVLRAYDRAMGDVAIEEVKPESVLAFITGTGPITTRWMEYHRVLGGLYRYAVSRGFATMSPLPTDTPRLPPPFIPYVYMGYPFSSTTAFLAILFWL
jgi:integrase/recombinase XerD